MATHDLVAAGLVETLNPNPILNSTYNLIESAEVETGFTLEDFSPFSLTSSAVIRFDAFPALSVGGGLHADAQRPDPGEFIELFTLDLTSLNGSVYYFCSSIWEDVSIVFGGNTYTPLPIKADGFEVNGRGALPQPTLALSNVKKLPGQPAKQFGSLLGAKVTRLRTFRRYLDNGEAPDAFATFRPDIYTITRMKAMNKTTIEWEMSSPMDHEGRKLPGRIILRDICRLRYRRYVNGSFDYSQATCPYTGSAKFTIRGNATTDPALDVCGKRIADCRARFGRNAELPYGGFPGVARVRT